MNDDESPVTAAVNPATRSTASRVLSALLVLDGVAVIGLWILGLGTGAFNGLGGLLVYQDGNFPAFHLAAELLMGALAVVTGIGLVRRRRWAYGLALLALGMLGYSAINSAGWAIEHDPTVLVPMIVTLVLVLIATPLLLRRIMIAESRSGSSPGGSSPHVRGAMLEPEPAQASENC